MPMIPTRQARGILRVTRAVMAVVVVHGAAASAEPTAAGPDREVAWRNLPSYRHGSDMEPLLAIEAEAFAHMMPPPIRAAMAARLAAVLGNPAATDDARAWVCLLLRQVGTPAEVPLLTRELVCSDSETADAARQAIESISGPAATQALIDFLPRSEGRMRLGIIASLGRRRDAAAVPALVPLVDGGDAAVADAAAHALSFIADPRAFAALTSLAERSGVPTPRPLHAPCLRAAETAAEAGDRPRADALYAVLSRQGQPSALRQAALQGLLTTGAQPRGATVLQWLAGDDVDRRHVAAAGVSMLDEVALATALAKLAHYAPEVQQAVLTAASRTIPRTAEPTLIRLAAGGNAGLQVVAIECLGRMGSSDCLPALLEVLGADAPENVVSPARAAARSALATMPRETVAPHLLKMLATRPQPSQDLVALVGEIRDPTAWDILAGIAMAPAPAPWQAAIASLGHLATPEPADLTKLVALYAAAQDRERREAVARIISLVSKRQTDGDPAGAVITAIDLHAVPPERALPLLGRLGGSDALSRIDRGLASPDPSVRTAAIEGLCNWPEPSVADRLLTLAKESLARSTPDPIGRQALRAYVRTVSLKSGREPEETLAMLREAMNLAADGPAEDRGYILERTAAAVRTMDAVEWIAGHLDAPSTSQAACRSIVELAHHKALRRPNAERFETLLERVAAVADDPAIAIRAQRYRLGL